MPDKFVIFPLGDSAATIYFGNVIDMPTHKKVASLYYKLSRHPFKGMIEVVACYASVTVFYNPTEIERECGSVFENVKRKLEAIASIVEESKEVAGKRITIPVCYDNAFAPDIETLSEWSGLKIDEIIGMHSSQQYHVYMVGFLPGFAYMGNVPAKIAMPRKARPEKVAVGSVGIAGIQTGIYPMDSPGGWQIIGKTPLKIFDVMQQPPCMLGAGDIVQFKPITKRELENFKCRHS